MILKVIPNGELKENCYILTLPGREDAVLIDPGSEADKIRAELGGKKAVAILLTHGHWDHTGALKDFSDVPIYMHELDAPMLKQKRFTAGGYQRDLEERPTAAGYVSEGQVLKLAGMTLQVIHTPGHTPGGVCYITGNDIFTGDTLFDGDYGRTDLPGGSMQQMRQSLRRLLAMNGFYAHPGHGGSFFIP